MLEEQRGTLEAALLWKCHLKFHTLKILDN